MIRKLNHQIQFFCIFQSGRIFLVDYKQEQVFLIYNKKVMGCFPSDDIKAQFIANLPELFEYYRKVVTYIKKQQFFKTRDARLQADVDLYLLNPRSFDTKNMKLCAIDSTHKLHPVDYGKQKMTREWLIEACLRQHKFIEEFPFQILQYEESLKHYVQFLRTCLKNLDRIMVPNKLADFMWHSHMQDSYRYKMDCQKVLGRVLDHLDDIPQPKLKEYAKYTDEYRKKESYPQIKYLQVAAPYKASSKPEIKHQNKQKKQDNENSTEENKEPYQFNNYNINFNSNSNAEISDTIPIPNDNCIPQEKNHEKHHHHNHHHNHHYNHHHHHKNQGECAQQKQSHHQHKNDKCENITTQHHHHKDHFSYILNQIVKPAVIQNHLNHHPNHAHHLSLDPVAIETFNHHQHLSSHGGHATTTEANHHSSCGGHATTTNHYSSCGGHATISEANHHSSCGGGHSSCGGGGHSSCGGGASSCGGGASSCGGGGSSCGGY